MPITALPPAPSRAEPSTFSEKGDALLGALAQFVTEANALETNVNTQESNAETHAADAETAKDLAESARDVALSAANYVGEWSDQTGAANVPYAVSHNGRHWQLTDDLADVTAKEPGVDPEWIEILARFAYKVLPDNICMNGGFDSNTNGWSADGNCSLASVPGGQIGNCLEITRIGSTSQYAYQEHTNIVPGETYRLSGYVKSGTSGNEGYYLVAWSGVELIVISGVTSGAWVKAAWTFVAPNSSVTIRLHKQSATPGTMLFDEIRLERITLDITADSVDLDGNMIFTNTGATAELEIPMPVATLGAILQAVVTEAQYIKFMADGTDWFRYYNQSGAAGGYIRSNVPGTSWEMVCVTPGEWLIRSLAGYLLYDQ